MDVILSDLQNRSPLKHTFSLQLGRALSLSISKRKGEPTSPSLSQASGSLELS